MIATPARLTRFYGDPTFALEVLERKQVALVRVTLLNDPFDPYGFFETEFSGYIGLSKYVQKEHPGDRGWFRSQVTPLSWGSTERDLKAYMTALRRHTFVLCTAAPAAHIHPKDNLYMWGHYGNGHRGLAVEFDSTAVATAVLAHNSSQGGIPLVDEQPWFQIKYATSFRAVSARDVFEFMKQQHEIRTRRKQHREVTSLDRYYEELAAIKSVVWQSENEWRLMWRSKTAIDNVYKIPISFECIRAVYLGLAISREDAMRVTNAAAQNFPAAEIWSATKRHGDLALEFQPLSR